MSDSVRPHRRQLTRLRRPWDSPSKNTGVGCHFLLQCMKVKSESEVAQSCPPLGDPTDCSLPGSSVRGIFQARVPVWGAIAFSRKQLSAAQFAKISIHGHDHAKYICFIALIYSHNIVLIFNWLPLLHISCKIFFDFKNSFCSLKNVYVYF